MESVYFTYICQLELLRVADAGDSGFALVNKGIFLHPTTQHTVFCHNINKAAFSCYSMEAVANSSGRQMVSTSCSCPTSVVKSTPELAF